MPVRILVTGDTHLSRRRDSLPKTLVEGLVAADIIIHTGDFSTVASHVLIEQYGCVFGVSGNNDERELSEMLPDQLVIVAGQRTIRVTHGHLERGPSARAAVQRTHAAKADLVIYGHSHKPHWEEVDATCFLNPGSPTMKRREPRYSFAWLDINRAGEFDISFVYFDEQK